MNKHKPNNQSGGFHQARLMTYEVFGYGLVLLLWPVTKYLAATLAVLLTPIGLMYLYYGVRRLTHSIPTAIGYGDLAIASSKKAAKSATKQAIARSKPVPKAAFKSA